MTLIFTHLQPSPPGAVALLWVGLRERTSVEFAKQHPSEENRSLALLGDQPLHLRDQPVPPEEGLRVRVTAAGAKTAVWKTPTDVKARYPSASILTDDRLVFNVKGNDYRLVVAMRYDLAIVFIRFVGTHAEYDRIDAETV